MDKERLIYTTDDCIGCNKCIKSCPGGGVNSSITDGNHSQIVVNADKCVHCGTCLRNCEHNARRFTDDLNDVLAALDNKEKIVLLIAPSFFLSYTEEAPHILALLKELGFYEMYDVSFGANITTWASIKYINQTRRTGLISSACPVIVDYIEKYKPSLLSRLMPVMSPAGCLMTYLSMKIYNEEPDVKYAFLGPCIGKHDEYTSYPNGRKFDYTFTYKTLFNYVLGNDINIKQYGRHECRALDSIGRGRFYPVPGGLSANIKNYIGESYFIKQIEGPSRVYAYLDTFEKMMLSGDNLPLMVDILNCEGGCNEGVATNSSTEDAEILMTRIHGNLPAYVTPKEDSAYSAGMRAEERWRMLDEYFSIDENLECFDFMRSYNENAALDKLIASPEALNEIFLTMNKLTEYDRNINCTSCGYKGCHEMATAIYFGFNKPENCVHFVKDELLASKHQLEQVLVSLTGGQEKIGLAMVDTDQIVEAILTAVNEVEHQREELDNTVHARTNMFASLTHELRTPLNAIMNMADMMDTNNLSEEQLESLSSIKVAGKGLMEIIGEILDFSKMEEGKFTIVEDKYCLHELLGEIVTVMNFRCLEKKLQFIRKLDPTLPDELYGDAKRIRQIAINIVGNAVKYTNFGSVTIDAGWNKDKENPVLIFSVTDTGMGIKKEDLPHLFDSYKQVNEKETRHIAGTGLGLYISKSLADSMGGSITVESTYKVGSKFTLTVPQRMNRYIPISEVVPAFGGQSKSVSSDALPKFAGLFFVPTYKALVIDDVPVNLQVARAFLDKMQIYTDIASSGAEGIKMCCDNHYDVLFIDHLMPEMGGLETIAAIKADSLNMDTPIIYLTAMDSDNLKDSVGESVQGFLEKPIKKEALWDTLRQIIPHEYIIEDVKGSIPEDEDIRKACLYRNVDELLKLYSEIERYSVNIGDSATTRFIKKYRIMLQQGHADLPIDNCEAVIARCHLLKG